MSISAWRRCGHNAGGHRSFPKICYQSISFSVFSLLRRRCLFVISRCSGTRGRVDLWILSRFYSQNQTDFKTWVPMDFLINTNNIWTTRRHDDKQQTPWAVLTRFEIHLGVRAPMVVYFSSSTTEHCFFSHLLLELTKAFILQYIVRLMIWCQCCLRSCKDEYLLLIFINIC